MMQMNEGDPGACGCEGGCAGSARYSQITMVLFRLFRVLLLTM